MCGIVAYIGKNKIASKVVFEGLKNLEYRGYDSWGIAIKKNNTFELFKKIGKIGNANPKLLKSNLAIGHTRWATHGGVTVENAHPHLDCTKKIVLVHNGIIENFEEIKKQLIKNKHRFLSETDTEVAVHLIEENLKKNNFENAVKKSFKKLNGLNAFVIADIESNQIAAVKNGTPIVIGVGKDEFFVASDISGISEYTKKIIFLEDDQMIVLGNRIKLFDIKYDKILKPKINPLNINIKKENKGRFRYFLQKEIFEQAQIIKKTAYEFEENSRRLSNLIKKAEGVFLVGCGSASYVCLAGTYLFSNISKIHLNFTTGSEFKYLENYLTSKTLVISISQSGETIDILDSVKKAKNKKAKIAVITNVFGSSLYRMSDHNFLLNAGAEKAVLATKSFTTMLAELFFASYAAINKKREAKEYLLKASKNIESILKPKYLKTISGFAKKIKNTKHIYVIGRGVSYPIAMETALKIKEASYIHAEGFAGGELKHGPIALIEKKTPVIVIINDDETKDETLSNAQEIKARGGYLIGIGSCNHSVFDKFFKTEDLGYATMLPQIVISQLISYYLTIYRGFDPDKPRNLAKSVTVK